VKQDGDGDGNGIAISSSNSTSSRRWKNAAGTLNIGSASNTNAFQQDLSGNISIEGKLSLPSGASYLPSLQLGTQTTYADDQVYGIRWGGNTLLGMGLHSATRGAFGKQGLVIHIPDTEEFGVKTDGWENLFSLDGATKKAYFGGNVGIGTTTPVAHAKLHVNGTLFVGENVGSDTGNAGGCIDFVSKDSENYGSSNYSSALIGTRTHHDTGTGGAAVDKMEMVFFMANNADSSYGPDRFSFIGSQFKVHTYSSNTTPGNGLFGKAALDAIGEDFEDTVPKFMVDSNGRVGIGTNSPRAGLDVVLTAPTLGNAGVDDNSVSYLRFETSGSASFDFNSSTDGYTVSIIGQGLIYAQQYIGASDKRIKKNIVEADDGKALQVVRDIHCCWYNYIDEIQRTSKRTIGFIAQDVAEHLPEAVHKMTDYIPNIMKVISTIWDDKTMSSTDIPDASGVKYKFYVSNDTSGHEIMKEVVSNADGSFTFDASYSHVFCYGKEVDDFHTLDKQKLFAMHFSATQEVDRIQQAEKTKVAAAEVKIEALQEMVRTLQEMVRTLTDRVAVLEA